jgi:hypothetical protein
MNKKEFYELKPGDMVKNVGSDDDRVFVVTANYGGRVTAVASVDLTNPPEWELVKLHNH